MPGLKERIARHLPHQEGMEGQPLVQGARTIAGELPEDGGMHYVERAKAAVGSRLPDHSAEFGDLPLVAPGTRSVVGELPSAKSQKEIASTPEQPAIEVGSVAVGELVAENPVPQSPEVAAHAEDQAKKAAEHPQPPEVQ